VLGVPGATRGDHRHRDGAGDGFQKFEVVTDLGAVAVHGGQQDLARAALDALDRIVDDVEARGVAAAIGEDLPARPTRLASIATTVPGCRSVGAAAIDVRFSRRRC
jgi:hypothetical protein